MDKRLLGISATLFVGLLVYGSVKAQDDNGSPVASPAGMAEPVRLVLVERDSMSTDLDLGATGPSAGDVRVWGPNPLYDEANTSDTGATTQGTCLLLHDLRSCLASETIVFEDGSTIVVEGVQLDPAGAMTRPIVGGSGAWLGATGTMTVRASEGMTVWTKTLDVWLEPAA